MTNQLANRFDRKIVLIVGVVVAVALIIISSVYHIRQTRLLKSEQNVYAQLIASKLQTTWAYNAQVFVDNKVEVTSETAELINLIHNNPKPLHSDSLSKGKEAASTETFGNSQIRVKQTSLNFRNPDNRPDDYEESQLKKFEEEFAQTRLGETDKLPIDPASMAKWDEADIKGEYVYRYMLPILVQKSCLHCHGDRNNAPQLIRENYASGYGYSEGDLIGAVSLVIPAESLKAQIFNDLIITVLLCVVAIGLCMGVILFYLKRKVALPIGIVVDSARRVSQGNLNERVAYEQDDEIGDLVSAFNDMVGMVKDSVKDIMDLTLRLNQVSLDISNTATSVLNNAENQAYIVQKAVQSVKKMGGSMDQIADDMQGLTINVRETRTSIEDLSGTIQEAARSVQEANQVFGQVIHEVQDGRYAIEQVNIAVSGISEKMESLHLQIQQFDRAIRDITTIADTMTRTAKQTNLLAVNASIESAIAGESGKGFRVVANEIRQLAEESTVASQQIRDMVFSVHQAAMKAVDTVLEATQVARDSRTTVKSTEKTLEKVTQYYSRSSSIMSRLSNLIDTQMRSTQQVTMKTSDMNIRTNQVVEQAEAQKSAGKEVIDTITSISKTALKNKEASIEISELTQQLIVQAEQLQTAIRRFKVTEVSQKY
ncbi:MAG: methyl-accepting chemotaxis protein [Chlorobiales bacterium]|nr:methyl-accepting chemotaxis protein [Chlorobiales bacterium]